MAVTGNNKTFRILSCIGILLIVLGHLNCNILEFGGLFPYYSYHVMIFVFIAGYFYREEDEGKPGKYLLRKLKKLIIPYLIINIIAGICVQLLHMAGFAYGGNLSVETLLIAPFVDGHQFGLNAPGWFVLALFLFECCNVFGRIVLSKLKLENEIIIMILYSLMGVLCVALSMRGMVYDYYRVIARIMFMAPFFQLGRLYRTKLERYDKLNSVIYLIVVVAINAGLKCLPYGLAYSAAWVNGFTNMVLPFATTVTGIALWLRISKLISGLCKDNMLWKIADYMGGHTLYICLFHLGVFLVINELLYKAGAPGFNAEEFGWNVYYSYGEWGSIFKLVYAVLGIAVPLGICFCVEKIKEKICG